MALGPSLTDDRGKPIRSSVAAWGPIRRHSEQLTRAKARAVERGMRPDPRVKTRRATLIATLVAMPFFFLPAILNPFLAPLLRDTVGLWGAIPLGAALGIIGPTVMFLALRRLFAGRIVCAYVLDGFCGGCGFPIRGLPTESDGCTVCPECGAAWRAHG